VSETSAAIPTPKTASKARLAELLLRKHRSCHNERGNLRQSHHNLPSLPTLTPHCHCERVKRAQYSPKKYPPTKKQKEKKKARLKGSMLSSGALYIHINGNKLS